MHGADPNAQDAEGRAPLISAIVTRNLHGICSSCAMARIQTCAALLPDRSALCDSVTIALMSKSEDAVKLLIAYGGELRWRWGMNQSAASSRKTSANIC